MEYLFVGEKKVGVLRDDKIFVARKNEAKHFFKKFEGYGFSFSILDKLKKKDCRGIVMIVKKKNGDEEAYFSSIDEFFEKGIPFKHDEFDFQRILPLKFWKKI